MRTRLEAFTDAGVFVLYDPQAVQHLIDAPYDTWFARIDDEARAGKLMVYTCGGDGDVSFEIVVDEAPDLFPEAQVRSSARGRIEIPSGRLCASGMEHLQPKRLPEPLSIAPGVYEIEASDLDFGEAPDLAAEQAASTVASPGVRRLSNVTLASLGCLALIAIVALPILLILWSRSSFGFVWDLAGPYVLAYLALVGVLLVLRLPKGVRRIAEAESQAYAAFPSLVVRLKPASEATPSTGVVLHT